MRVGAQRPQLGCASEANSVWVRNAELRLLDGRVSEHGIWMALFALKQPDHMSFDGSV